MTPTGKVERVWMDERRSVAVDEIGTKTNFGMLKLGIESSIPLSLNKSANVFKGSVTSFVIGTEECTSSSTSELLRSMASV